METVATGMDGEEDEESKVKKIPFSKQENVFLESENNSFWERKKVILSCMKKKSNGYSLKVHYPLVEEEQKLEV